MMLSQGFKPFPECQHHFTMCPIAAMNIPILNWAYKPTWVTFLPILRLILSESSVFAYGYGRWLQLTIEYYAFSAT